MSDSGMGALVVRLCMRSMHMLVWHGKGRRLTCVRATCNVTREHWAGTVLRFVYAAGVAGAGECGDCSTAR